MSFIEYNENQILTKYDFGSELATNNFDYWQQTFNKYSNLSQQIKLGGGLSNIEKQHQKGRLTARERLKFLLDENTDFFDGVHDRIRVIERSRVPIRIIKKKKGSAKGKLNKGEF